MGNYKTLRNYLQGGRINYQSGGYIPGLSNIKQTMGLRRDKRAAEEEMQEFAEASEKESKWRSRLGMLGKGLGMAAGVALAPMTGGVSLAAGKAIGAGLGKGLGDFGAGKIFDAGTAKSSTGLFRDQFEDLNKRARAEEDAVFKKAAMTGATTYFDATGGMDSLKSSAIKGAGNIFGMDKIQPLLDTISPSFSKTDPRTVGLQAGLDKANAFELSDLEQYGFQQGGLTIPYESGGVNIDNSTQNNPMMMSQAGALSDFAGGLRRDYSYTPEERSSFDEQLGTRALDYERSVQDKMFEDRDREEQSLNNLMMGDMKPDSMSSLLSLQNSGGVQDTEGAFLKSLENMVNPSSENALMALDKYLETYTDRSELTGDSSDLDFNQAYQKRLRGYNMGGKVKKNPYDYNKGGNVKGLLSMMPYSRRIL